MTTASAHEFFQAAASVVGALIGLLFVAISVAPERILGPDAAEVHRVRASASLTAFSNALAVALFGLVPGYDVGYTAVVVAVLGLLFIAGALTRVFPAWRAERIQLTDITFLLALVVVFVIQLHAGLGLDAHPHDGGALQTICVLVIVCCFIGIARAWELVGGPQINLRHQLYDRLKRGRGPRETGRVNEP